MTLPPQLNFKPVEHNPFVLPEIQMVVPAILPQLEIFTSCFAGGEDANRSYNESISLKLSGEFRREAMVKALEELVQRHEALRSCFSADGSQVFIFRTIKVDIYFEDLSSRSAQEQDKFISEYKNKEAHTSFNLQNGPLFRVSLFKLSPIEHYLTFSSHHIVCDGWSLGIIMQDLSAMYSAYSKGTKTSGLQPAPRFSDYAREQYRFCKSDEYLETEQFWINLYKNSVPVLDLPTDFPRPAVRTYKSRRDDFQMDQSLVAGIKNIGATTGCSFVTTFLSLFQLYLHRLTGQDDIVIGLPAAGQSVTGNYKLVSHCVNLLPLRCTIDDADSFTQFLKNQKRMLLDAYDHQLFTFSSLLQKLSIARDPSRIPLVPLIFNVDLGMDDGVRFEGLKHQYFSNPRAFETFEIFLNASGSEQQLTLEWSYNTQLFDSSTILYMMKGFEELVGTVIRNPHTSLHDIKLAHHGRPNDAYSLLNNTQSEYPRNTSLHHLIEEEAIRHSKKTAVRFEGKQLTYQEFNEVANQLASLLIEKGVRKGDVIAVAMERSEKMIPVLVGIMKSGAVYLPLDPEYPRERREFMIADSMPRFVLTSKKYRGSYQNSTQELIIEDLWPGLKRYSTRQVQTVVHGDDLAYILYTSGSTGKPKGVKIAHHNLVNFLYSLRTSLNISERDNLLAITTLSFDISGLEMYLPLICGASVTVASSQVSKDGNQLLSLIKSCRPAIMQATPATWNMLIEAGWHEDVTIPTICCGGESLSRDLAQKLVKRSRNLYNLYGPTETTIWSTIKKISANDDIITIGHPIANTQIYILDNDLSLVSTNVVGEIFIAGDGVAKGYHNRPDLTSERFLDNRFSKIQGDKMYRTGDLGRILPNGEIECLGRADQQIKVRGYRIEPGEIEHCLMQNTDVKSAVVVLREDRPGDQRLVAYIVPRTSHEQTGKVVPFQARGTKNESRVDVVDKGTAKASPEQLQAWKDSLRNALPAYMIPNEFLVLRELPHTPNGKIDKKALPPPEPSAGTPRKYAPPSNEMEAFLIDIWKGLLRVDDIGIHDNFFELGGHSLLAMRLITAMRTKLNVEIPLIEIFDSTVQSLAEKIRKLKQSDDTASPVKSGFNLTPTQASAMGKEFVEAVSEWGLTGKGKYLIPIHPEGTKLPFIGIISFYSYHLLAKYLPDDQPLYYLPPTRAASVEVIAAHYVKEIKQLQPNGPYCIGGFCDGGNVAFEIAHQLEAQGDEVAALILFELYSPQAAISKKSFKYIKRRVRYYIKRVAIQSRSGRNPFKLLKVLVKNSYERFKDSFMEPPPPKFITSPEYTKYVYKPYSGKVILFKAGNPPLEIEDLPLLGWADYFKGDVSVITVDGGHLGIFREPGIQQTGEKLGAALSDLDFQVKSTDRAGIHLTPFHEKRVPVINVK